jgi:hypothetical protein
MAPAADPPPGKKSTSNVKENRSDPAAEGRLAIRRHVAKKAGRRAVIVAVTGKDAWAFCAEQYLDHEKDPRALYGLIGNHLLTADSQFLSSKKIVERRKGLGMALEACNCATHDLKDKWLATQIATVYLRPNLDAADRVRWKYLNAQTVLEAMADAYAAAQDAHNLAETYQSMIELAPNRNTADAARMRLATLLARHGAYEPALNHLRAIDDDSGVAGAKRLIPEFEAKLKEKQAEKQAKELRP